MSATPSASGQQAPVRDEFFWLGQINKASAVINSEEGLLDAAFVPKVVRAISKVIDDGNAGGKRPATVITFEPLMIEAEGQEVTLLHAGRSSQDMHGTFYAAIVRDNLLALAEELNKATATLLQLAERHAATVVPNYTNGVPAQPNSYGHYLLAFAAGFERDAQRLREAYARLDRSPMGTTVLNGTSWPLNRVRMAAYLGFGAIADNAYDAVQISSMEYPAEAGAVLTAIALHVGNFIEDLMTQYAQCRPWILLQEGGDNTYVSSAMPQKRNPGILNNTRRDASTAISLAMGTVMRAHNIPPGMVDAKSVPDNTRMLTTGVAVLRNFNKILGALVIDPARALEELNSDWTASQEVADVLMREYKLPFRVGHHFASNMVSFAKKNNIKPLEFPYDEAKRIYADVAGKAGDDPNLPMSEQEFRRTLDPVAIVQHRATSGGPQPAEMTRMLAEANKCLAAQQAWVAEKKNAIDSALRTLDSDFAKLPRS